MSAGPKIGDLIPKSGIYTNPGVVVEKKDDGTVTVDTDPMAVNKFHRYTNTSGLSEQEKHTFNGILDQIYQSRDSDVDKINDIQQEIDKLKADPENRNVVQYLRNQQSHLIRKSRELPRMYNSDFDKLRT
jgi:FtsZ-binding cell division protein ZapB